MVTESEKIRGEKMNLFDIFQSKSIETSLQQIAGLQTEIADTEVRYQTKCQEIEDKYGPDCLALLRKQKPEQPVKGVNKIIQVRDSDGTLLNFREEYIQKRDGSLVLLRVVGLN
jgi:hypothetical protein